MSAAAAFFNFTILFLRKTLARGGKYAILSSPFSSLFCSFVNKDFAAAEICCFETFLMNNSSNAQVIIICAAFKGNAIKLQRKIYTLYTYYIYYIYVYI